MKTQFKKEKTHTYNRVVHTSQDYAITPKDIH